MPSYPKQHEAEGIEVEDDDISAEIDKMVGDSPQAQQLRTVFESDNSREMIKRNVLTRKTLEALGEYASTNFENGVLPTLEPAIGESESDDEAPAEPDAEQDDEATEGEDT